MRLFRIIIIFILLQFIAIGTTHFIFTGNFAFRVESSFPYLGVLGYLESFKYCFAFSKPNAGLGCMLGIVFLVIVVGLFYFSKFLERKIFKDKNVDKNLN